MTQDTLLADNAAVPPFERRMVATRACDVFCVDHGHARDDLGPILLIHGGHGAWSHWRANIGPLGEHARVVAPDLPGFGLSGDLADYSLAALAAAISELIDALSLRRITLVGYSFGSLVAATVAGLRGDCIDRLMLVNPPGWGERSPETARAYDESAALARRDGLRAGLRHTLQRLMLWDLSRIDEACIDATEAAVRNTRFVSRGTSMGTSVLWLLSRVDVPVHVCFGAEDPSHKYRLAERVQLLQAAKGQGCVTAVASARHWLQQDRPETFNDLLLAFRSGRDLPRQVAATTA